MDKPGVSPYVPPDGLFLQAEGTDPLYVTGTGQVVRNLHDADACAGEHCVIHNPSRHRMRSFKTHWRGDRYLMERICSHGVGHPDPDHISAVEKLAGPEAAKTEGVHGCDGCCTGRRQLSEARECLDRLTQFNDATSAVLDILGTLPTVQMREDVVNRIYQLWHSTPKHHPRCSGKHFDTGNCMLMGAYDEEPNEPDGAPERLG